MIQSELEDRDLEIPEAEPKKKKKNDDPETSETTSSP